jgi:hypothetical protein
LDFGVEIWAGTRRERWAGAPQNLREGKIDRCTKTHLEVVYVAYSEATIDGPEVGD